MNMQDTHIIRRQIAGLLHEVADPEIPVVSIVDLGMVLTSVLKTDIGGLILHLRIPDVRRSM